MCDELERAIEFVGTSDVMVSAVHLHWLIEDARTPRGIIEANLPVRHHHLAGLVARGHSDAEMAEITCYSLADISMKSDPTFAELVAGYRVLQVRSRESPTDHARRFRPRRNDSKRIKAKECTSHKTTPIRLARRCTTA